MVVRSYCENVFQVFEQIMTKRYNVTQLAPLMEKTGVVIKGDDKDKIEKPLLKVFQINLHSLHT